MTPSTTKTINIKFDEFGNSEILYPCRCGEIHHGEYGAEDFAHHNCLHRCDLMISPLEGACFQIICPICGASFIGRIA
jgi:hypothetical protein